LVFYALILREENVLRGDLQLFKNLLVLDEMMELIEAFPEKV
jgi:hypothetical protein